MKLWMMHEAKEEKCVSWGRKISHIVLKMKWMEDPNKKTCTVDETEGHFSGWICTLMHANVTLFKCYSLSNTRPGCACVFAFMWGSRRPCLFCFIIIFYFFKGKRFLCEVILDFLVSYNNWQSFVHSSIIFFYFLLCVLSLFT